MKRLLLAGGGHAQLSVLLALSRNRPAGIETVLVTPGPRQSYSGMLPGWIAGHYSSHQCHIDLRPLVAAARIRMIEGKVTGIDAAEKQARLDDGTMIEFDTASLDIGSETRDGDLAALGERVLRIKPLEAFMERWARVMDEISGRQARVVVAGGGAGGVEVALGAAFALGRAGGQAQVDLVTSTSGLLADHAASVRQRISRILERSGVRVAAGPATVVDGKLSICGVTQPADYVIAVTGARPLAWLRETGLATDDAGYIAVDATHRSVSHPHIFAAGDVCARVDVRMARSGVHAVHAGPILAHNLLAPSGSPLRTYQPRSRSLYLLACGPRWAVASWGSWSAEGAWVWRWKDHIDRGFIRRFMEAT